MVKLQANIYDDYILSFLEAGVIEDTGDTASRVFAELSSTEQSNGL